MYLFIHEDGHVQKVSKVGDDDLQACEDGYLDVIDISDNQNPRRRIGGAWEEVESAD